MKFLLLLAVTSATTAFSQKAVAITSILSINKPMFSPNEYAGLREFFNLVVAKQTEQIVIKRK